MDHLYWKTVQQDANRFYKKSLGLDNNSAIRALLEGLLLLGIANWDQKKPVTTTSKKKTTRSGKKS